MRGFSDNVKIVTSHVFIKDGHPPVTAARATAAALPLGKVRPSRAFQKGARNLAKQFTQQSKQTDDLYALATETLEALRLLALEHGESHYADVYANALRAPTDEEVAALNRFAGSD